MRLTLLFISGFALLAVISCNRYVDVAKSEKKIAVYQGYLTFYPDSNTFNFKSNIGISMDREVYHAKPFYTRLPKGLLFYELSNAQTFAFYYKRGQVISILIDLTDKTSNSDSFYQPTKGDIEKFRISFSNDVKQQYNMWNIEYKRGRKQLLIKRGAASILLYNILPVNYDRFVSLIDGFKFI